jgi:DNA-binding MarR family transcriptional regulator
MEADAEEFRHLIHCFIRRFGLLDQAQTPCGMSLPVSQAHALMEVLRAPGLTQNELAERLGLSKSNVSRLVQSLLKAGRAKSQRDGKDGRANRIVLTAKGRRAATELDKRSLARFSDLLAHLPERRRGSVARALALLAEAVQYGSKKRSRP